MHGELRALPEGYDYHYGAHVGGQVSRFLEKNQNGTLGVEYVFVTYEEWRRIVAGMSSTRWGDLMESVLTGR
jgi:hypothetical protein